MYFENGGKSKHKRQCIVFFLRQQMFIGSCEMYKDCTCNLNIIVILSFSILNFGNLYGQFKNVMCPIKLKP